ncbi:MAG: Wzz/FepE/Etk N-terminal domain-containing protein [Gaiellaceae bacterium]
MRLTWLRRRGWVVVTSAVACALAAVAMAAVLRDAYTAVAIVIVPATSDEGAIGNVDQAAKLASTYAQLIPSDDAVLAAIGTELGIGSQSVAARLSVANDPGRSLLRLQFLGLDSAEAVRGAEVAAQSVVGGDPVSENLEPDSITLVRLPATATLTGETPFTHLAVAVVLVPARAARTGPGNAGEASNLATTYADLIPEDRVILASVAEELDLDPEAVRRNTAVNHDFDTSILRLSFTDPDPELALAGARILAESVTGPEPVSPRIAPRSLALVHLPTAARSEAMSPAKVAVLGLVLGLALGIVVLLAWERADGRIDDVKTLSEEAGCAASALGKASKESIAALLDRWSGLVERSPARIALLPVSRSSEDAAAGAAERLVQGGFLTKRPVGWAAGGSATPQPQVILEVGGMPGSVAAGESLALSSDLIVLVAVQGTRIADLRETLAVLEQFGSTPVWALLAPTRAYDRNVHRIRRQDSRRSERRELEQGG